MLNLGLRDKLHKLKNRLRRNWFKSIRPAGYQSSYEYEHVLCAVTHNEAEILEEWVLFHLAVGFERIILYDDRSTDSSHELLKDYQEAGIIEWRQLGVEQFTMWHQIRAYNKALRDYQGQAKWMWFLDTDEFLVPARTNCISNISRKIEADTENGGIAVNWVLYGTSNVEKLEPGKWHIEVLTQRASLDWNSHWVTKCGLRPEAAAGFFENPHWAMMFKNRKLVYTDKLEYNGNHINHEDLRVHHYWHRTEQFFREIKIDRQKMLMGKEFVEYAYGPKARKLHHDAHNKVEDKRMLHFVDRMKEIKNKVTGSNMEPKDRG